MEKGRRGGEAFGAWLKLGEGGAFARKLTWTPCATALVRGAHAARCSPVAETAWSRDGQEGNTGGERRKPGPGWSKTGGAAGSSGGVARWGREEAPSGCCGGEDDLAGGADR